MKTLLVSLFVLFLLPISALTQEVSETNTDIILQQALEAYKNSEFQSSLLLTKRGLLLAPEYHDIRILQIRNYWALENFTAADAQLNYLLEKAPEYAEVKPLVHQRVPKFFDENNALQFIEVAQKIYPEDITLLVIKAQTLLNIGRRKEAREQALKLVSKEGITGANRYQLHIILNRTISDEIGVNYNYVGFSKDYSQNSWHSVSTEYQHNFNRTAVIGRINYSDRNYANGTLYELEAYPVFNDRFYAFTNIGVSSGTVFPDVRSSLSLFYNFARIFEAEAGGRMVFVTNNSLFTGILGLTLYQGKFYLNARSFIGPERSNELVQNYQGNVRYYYKNTDNYLFLRVGTGISPDERSRLQLQKSLEAYYGHAGINFSLGIHHILQIAAGVLNEDVTEDVSGTQFVGTAGYRYRF